MADLCEPDFGAAYYRSNDPIKNLNIRVVIERVTSSSIVPQEATTEQPGSNVEMRSVKDEVATKDVDECTFSWQKKVFSLREVEKYKNDDPEFSAMEKKYHLDVQAILEKHTPSNRLFSYVDHDSFSQQDENISYMTTSEKEKPSLLTEKMAHVRRRKVGGPNKAKNQEGSFVPKVNTVEYNPNEELRNKNHIMAAPMQVMYIMADLSPKDRQAAEDDETVLCTILLDSNGVICIRPDFNKGRKPYIVESAVGRDIFEYSVENISKIMNRQEQDKEMKMYREVYSRHKDFLEACVGDEFEMPQQGVLRLLINGEIESARDFEYDDLYIHFFVDLPKHWTSERQQQLSWVTHTCRTKVEGRDDVAHFSFPFSLELFYKDESILEEEKEPLPHFPIILVEVLSLDSWKRFRTEGYTYFNIPARPGVFKEHKQCWRPIGKTIVSELRRYFIGGSPELEDLTYAAVPTTFQGSHLGKYGFRTETTGSVDMKLNVIMQSKSFLENKANKRSLGNLLDNLGINAVQANISSVLDAFKKARLRMMQARDNAAKELMKDTVKTNS